MPLLIKLIHISFVFLISFLLLFLLRITKNNSHSTHSQTSHPSLTASNHNITPVMLAILYFILFFIQLHPLIPAINTKRHPQVFGSFFKLSI